MIITSGSTLDDRYELERRLGSGGFGEVFAATHVVTKSRCAVKLLAARPSTETQRQRLLREARLAATLVDDHITRVLDAGVHDGRPFVVMELLEGEDLGRRIDRGGALGPGLVALCLLHVACALTAAHERDIVHLDLKPRNMFLTRDGDGRPSVKLLDFGTAKLIRHGVDDSSTFIAGTPVYMAPEQFTGAPVGPPADLYAYGMSAFHMLVGHAYYELEQQQADNPFALGARLMHGPPESASSRAARYDTVLPGGFDPWFARCTHVDPTRRFASAQQAHAGLLEALCLSSTAIASVRVEAFDDGLAGEPHPAAKTETLRGPDRSTRVTRVALHRPARSVDWVRRITIAVALCAMGAWVLRSAVSASASTLSSELLAATPSLEDLARDPALSFATSDCRAGYQWYGIKARVYLPRGVDGSCDDTPQSSLAVFIHDHRPSSSSSYESYRYLQRHLARNGFISVSIEVADKPSQAASRDALFLMEDFLAFSWPDTGSAELESVALVGHGRGATTVRLLAEKLEGHPIFGVKTLVTLQPRQAGPALGSRHADAHFELVSDSSAPTTRDAIPSTRKLVTGTDAGFAGGATEQNRAVQGYLLAFLAAHHQGRLPWYGRYVAGDAVPGEVLAPK